jgi:hypothetical protein
MVILIIFWPFWKNILWSFGIFYDHLLYFMVNG